MKVETYDERLSRHLERFGALVGKTVRRLFVAEREDALIFDTDAGLLEYETTADCCSETWFSDICGFDALIGSPIVSAEAVELPEPADNRTRQEYDEAYGIKIVTTKGVCDIAYRNSSNGYYGGSAYRAVEPRSDVSDLTEITGDWQA